MHKTSGAALATTGSPTHCTIYKWFSCVVISLYCCLTLCAIVNSFGGT